MVFSRFLEYFENLADFEPIHLGAIIKLIEDFQAKTVYAGTH